MWYYKDNEERLLEWDTPTRSCDTASLLEDLEMMHLYAKGNKVDTGRTACLWGYGNFKYEIEAVTATPGILRSEVFYSTYEEAMKKFEKVVDKVELL